MFSFSDLIQYLLMLPIILLALSTHEVSHGLAAYKLGDHTARDFGRLTLNPLKHLDPFGVICMLLFRFGWAKPVPVNARYFKNPRRDMALTAAAGPVSNILLSFVFALLLRVQLFAVEHFFYEDMIAAAIGSSSVSMGFKMMCVLAYILYMGVLLNINLAVFNLIPIPPFDGSRIAYVFLPQNFYFKIMRYERYIMIGILLLLLFTPFLSNTVGAATEGLSSLIMRTVGISGSNNAGICLWEQINYLLLALFS